LPYHYRLEKYNLKIDWVVSSGYMKKYITLFCLMLFISVFGLTAKNLPVTSQSGSSRILGLGGAAISISDNLNMQTMNPAALYFSTTSQLHAGLSYVDTFELNGPSINGLEDLLDHPSVTIDIVFTTPGWYLGAYSDYCLENNDYPDGILSIDVARLNVVKAGMAFGIGSFSLGADIRASKTSYLNNRMIGVDDDLVSIGAEFLQKIFFAEYGASKKETMELGLGMMIDAGIFTFGIYSDKVIDFITESGSGFSIDVSRILQSLDFGISLSTEEYTGAGNLRLAHLLVAADIKDIGDSTSRTLNLGLEGSLYFANRVSLALQLGYNQPFSDVNSILSLGGNENGMYSIGVTSDLLFMTLNAAIVLPYKVLESVFDNSVDSISGSVAGAISFSFSL
jgi:hypothetical protein